MRRYGIWKPKSRWGIIHDVLILSGHRMENTWPFPLVKNRGLQKACAYGMFRRRNLSVNIPVPPQTGGHALHTLPKIGGHFLPQIAGRPTVYIWPISVYPVRFLAPRKMRQP